MPGIAAAVLAFARLEAVVLVARCASPRFELGDQPVALGIDVRGDVVGDLAGRVAQANAPVEGRGANQGGRSL